MRLEIHKSKWRQRYWVRVVADNGEPVFVSENYADKRDARQAARLILTAGKAVVLDLTGE